MKTNYKKIKNLIIDFENEQITLKYALIEINKLSFKDITKIDLVSYSGYTTLHNFINSLIVVSIKNWNEIDDHKAIYLIDEILCNLNNDVVIDKNSEALEKRYKKPTGTITDWIFYQEITEKMELLKKLKTNDIIQL